MAKFYETKSSRFFSLSMVVLTVLCFGFLRNIEQVKDIKVDYQIQQNRMVRCKLIAQNSPLANEIKEKINESSANYFIKNQVDKPFESDTAMLTDSSTVYRAEGKDNILVVLQYNSFQPSTASCHIVAVLIDSQLLDILVYSLPVDIATKVESIAMDDKMIAVLGRQWDLGGLEDGSHSQSPSDTLLLIQKP